MLIRPKETFEQTHERLSSAAGNSFGRVDELKFAKNQVYEFYIVPKVTFIDVEADECEIDYPFEEMNTHFGTYDFMRNYANIRSSRINCRGCAIDHWMSESRLPKSVFKIVVPTKFFVSYVIHDKKIKFCMFQDYLYGILMEKLAALMVDKNLNLIDALSHKIKLFTGPQNKFDIIINSDVALPTDSPGFQKILVSVADKPLDRLIDQQLTCDTETINAVLHALKDYTNEIIKEENNKERAEKMEEKSKQFEASLEGFRKISGDSSSNASFVENVGPQSNDADADSPDDLPF